jgi:acyl-CoA synthetase (NDP forming)
MQENILEILFIPLQLEHRKYAAHVHDAVVAARCPGCAGPVPVVSMNKAGAKTLFASFGISSVRERVVANAKRGTNSSSQTRRKGLLTLLSNEITHKSEVRGGAVGVFTDWTPRLKVAAKAARRRSEA